MWVFKLIKGLEKEKWEELKYKKHRLYEYSFDTG